MPNWDQNFFIFIHNTAFSYINSKTAVILLKETHITLKGPIMFTNIVSKTITLLISSQIHLKQYINFSYNKIQYGIVTRNVIILDGKTTLNILANVFSVFFFTLHNIKNSFHETDLYCLFQYIETNQTYPLTSREQLPMQHKKYSIIVQDNIGDVIFNKILATSHCDWTDVSVYKYQILRK